MYVAFGCPWAHRVLILRKMKKLENVISMDVVHFIKSQHGWHFDDKVKMMVSILPKDKKYSKKNLWIST